MLNPHVGNIRVHPFPRQRRHSCHPARRTVSSIGPPSPDLRTSSSSSDPSADAGTRCVAAPCAPTLDKTSIPATGEVAVSVKVTNTGNRAGKETVIVYVRDEVASATPAGKRVKRFAKVWLEPGQTKTLSFKLGAADLSFIGTNNKPTVEPGDFTVLVGDLKAGFVLK